MQQQKKRRYWVSERIRQLFGDSLEVALEELGKKKRVLDFFLVPGKVQVKLQDENNKMHRVEFEVQEFTEMQWETVCRELASKSLFLAHFLSGKVPEEIDSLLSTAGLSLPPVTSQELTILCDGQRVNKRNSAFAFVALDRLLSRLDEDPFSIFVLRGKGREEILLEVYRQRMSLPRPHGEIRSEEEKTNEEVSVLLQGGIDRFWRSASSMDRLSYSIRADELPASLLKRLDPMPLGGVEDIFEPLLEDAYAQVARRAQAYGLELQERE